MFLINTQFGTPHLPNTSLHPRVGNAGASVQVWSSHQQAAYTVTEVIETHLVGRRYVLHLSLFAATVSVLAPPTVDGGTARTVETLEPAQRNEESR